YTDSVGPVVLGVPFDRGRVLLFIDPLAVEGLAINLTQGKGSAQGSFKLATEPVSANWTGLDVDATSEIDPAPLGKLLPEDGAAAIAAFAFDRPPSASVRGHFDGANEAGDHHKKLHVEVRSGSGLRIHGVAFDKAAFKVDLNDDDVDVTDIDAGFAGGTVTGTANLSGNGAARRVKFKASLAGASLGLAAEAAEGYVASNPAGSSTALETFARDKSGVRLDLNASATGRAGDLSSFTGEGNFQVQGNQLGELTLLGGLSKVLKFSDLRFTQARAEFKIENSLLVFPELSVLGANSAIKAKGTYSIDRRLLDFTASIYPFQESKSILQIFNALSSPISAIFRVKLGGSIDNPTWNLAYSPLNLLRDGDQKAGPADRPAAPSPLANPPP
ncbi:MAG TPA: AsmA-like C-terminal region-containing protein, partial [Opitutaceae bacterium]